MARASIIMKVTEMWGVGMVGCQECRNNPKSEGEDTLYIISASFHKHDMVATDTQQSCPPLWTRHGKHLQYHYCHTTSISYSRPSAHRVHTCDLRLFLDPIISHSSVSFLNKGIRLKKIVKKIIQTA